MFAFVPVPLSPARPWSSKASLSWRHAVSTSGHMSSRVAAHSFDIVRPGFTLPHPARCPVDAGGRLAMTIAEKPEHTTNAKELAARYGGAYLGTSIVLSLVSFGILYALIAAGVNVRGGIVALGDWLATTPLGRPSALDQVSDAGGTFALAYIAHKVTSPLRFPPTIVATEFVARALGKAKTIENPAEPEDN